MTVAAVVVVMMEVLWYNGDDTDNVNDGNGGGGDDDNDGGVGGHSGDDDDDYKPYTELLFNLLSNAFWMIVTVDCTFFVGKYGFYFIEIILPSPRL